MKQSPIPPSGIMPIARGCWNCAREPEPGWIETDNNGPIVPCPICEPLRPILARPVRPRPSLYDPETQAEMAAIYEGKLM